MNESEFKFALDALRARSSRNTKKAIIRAVADSPEAISFLAGTEFDDMGLGKKTVQSVAQEMVFGEHIDGTPTVSESLEQEDNIHAEGQSLENLHEQMEILAGLSGNEQKDALAQMLHYSAFPSVVAFACLNDWPTGVSDSTIASALGVKESLPFYDGVHEVAKEHDPMTSPEVASPFSPMLAVPESRGRPDNAIAQKKVDGYRLLLHKGKTVAEFMEQAEDPDPVRAFSRRKNEVTESLPEFQEMGLQGLEGHYILDGEVLAETGSYADTSSRVGRSAENVERDVEMVFHAFDIVVYRGIDVSNRAYWERYNMLRQVEEALDTDYFEVLPVSEDIDEMLDSAIEAGHEGIIVKDRESPYQYGKRSSYWQKVKVDDETCDVVVTGFDEGDGRLSGTLGRVRIESEDGVHLGYSGSGFTDEQRDEVWNNQDEWMGRTIEVEARGIGSQGKLRMPIFVRDRDDDGSPDSWERIQEVMPDV